MYDPKSEAKEFVADTADDAIAKASAFFGRPAAALRLRTLAEVSGLGARALVVAVPADAAPASERRGGGGREERERPPRDARRGREGRGDSRERDRDRDRDREPPRETRAREEAPAAAPAAASVGPSVGTARGEIGPVGQFLLGMVERMELGPFEVSMSDQDGYQIFEITGAAVSGLTAGDARAPEALQLLASQAASLGQEEPRRVVVNVEGGSRDKRDELLERVAERAAKRAQETGRAVALDPMSSRDRRIIHIALRGQDGIATMSIGEGAYRQVVVVPEGAPEYAEAKAAASNAPGG